MERLFIERSEDTPEIVFDKEKGIFEITGLSLPENSFEFYEQPLNWLKEYIKNPNDLTVFNFRLDYFNSSSSKEIVEILCELEKLIPVKKDVVVDWYYNKEDELFASKAEEFMTIIAIPFQLRPY